MTYQSSSPKVYKPKRHIIIDCETLSTKRNASVVDIAAIAIDFNGRPSQEFQTFIRRGEQVEAGHLFHTDEETIDWHNRHDPEFLPLCENNGVSFQEAMASLNDWILAQELGVELHFWSQGKDFDFPILENMLDAAGLKAPWKYSRLHCLRDLVFLNPGSRLKGSGPVAHKALLDARHEAEQLIHTTKSSSWLQRLFK